jgi:hypothetical protein
MKNNETKTMARRRVGTRVETREESEFDLFLLAPACPVESALDRRWMSAMVSDR